MHLRFKIIGNNCKEKLRKTGITGRSKLTKQRRRTSELVNETE